MSISTRRVIPPKRLRIGIDFHNLSIRDNQVVRTGIQQVVFHLLQASVEFRPSGRKEHVDIIPIPFLPYEARHTRFPDLMPLHGNASPLVLKATEKELGMAAKDLWADDRLQGRWNHDEFYEALKNLDWVIFTGLCDFRFMVEQVRETNPRIKVGILVYDLIPLILPETTSHGMSKWFSTSYISSIFHYADVVFTCSRHTALDCSQHLYKILGRHLPIVSSPIFSEIPLLEADDVPEAKVQLTKMGIELGKYFVCIGTIEPRKNAKIVIAGFLRFLQMFPEEGEGYKLLLIGTKGWNSVDAELIDMIGERKASIMMPGYMDKKLMEAAICFSSGLLMPSRYEGFGMPLKLAENYQIPVISCINSSLPEAAGFSAFFVRTDNADEVGLAMGEIAKRGNTRCPEAYDFRAINQNVRKQWQGLFEDWIDVIKSLSGFPGGYQEAQQRAQDNPSIIRNALVRTKRRIKICFEVHNLSLEPAQFEKSGIQAVTFSLLSALAKVREEYKNDFELIALPCFPEDSYFVPTYAPTVQVLPQVLMHVEKEIGCSGPDLWGFDLKRLNYQLGLDDFHHITRDSDWFSVLSQYDIRRLIRHLLASAPNVKISHIIYDVIPALLGQFVPKILEDWFCQSYLKSVRDYSSLASCISRHSALDFLNIDSNRSQLNFPVYSQRLPIDNFFLEAQKPLRRTVRDFDLHQHPYFVVVGNTDPRKNTKLLIEAFLQLHRQYPTEVKGLRLVSVGPKVWRTSDIMSKMRESSEHLVELGYIDDGELQLLAGQSRGIVMPSRYEGFGIPLAIGRGFDTPVLTCINSSLPEAAGLNAVLVDPMKKDDLVLGLLTLWNRTAVKTVKEDSWIDYMRNLIELHRQHL